MPVATRSLELLGLPLAILRRSEALTDQMLDAAEQALDGGAGGGLTGSLAIVVRALNDEYSDLSNVSNAEVDRAEAAGESHVDLVFEAPVTMASAAETWLRLLEHLDDLAAGGQFASDPTPPDLVDFRRWLVDEIVSQLREGRAPRPFVEGNPS